MNHCTRHKLSLWTAGLAFVGMSACSGSGDPKTPAQARLRGDTLLKQMSDTLARATTFSFDTAETHDRVRRNGEKVTFDLHRQFVVRRPDRLWSHVAGGDDRDFVVTYDGHKVTLVGNKMKVYAAFDAPPTLDKTLEMAENRFDLPMPVSDLLYSSAYDSYADVEATGGWARHEVVDGKNCEVVSYQLKPVDFTMWIASEAPKVPSRLEVTFKTAAGQPKSRLSFSNWNLSATADDAKFVASVPDGYEHIPIIEKIPKTELKADPVKAMEGQ
jgi:hypothetical protein